MRDEGTGHAHDEAQSRKDTAGIYDHARTRGLAATALLAAALLVAALSVLADAATRAGPAMILRGVALTLLTLAVMLGVSYLLLTRSEHRESATPSSKVMRDFVYDGPFRIRRTPTPPASARAGLIERLNAHARIRWPELARIEVCFRTQFAYVTGTLAGGEQLPLCRLRYAGHADSWEFALYRTGNDDYQDNILPNGRFTGSPEEALDRSCGLYLNDPTGWTMRYRANTAR